MQAKFKDKKWYEAKDQMGFFCRSCGEPIKKEAEICPECGVRNGGSTPNHRTKISNNSPVHDPTQYNTTISESWYYGVIIGLGLWIMVFIAASADTGGAVIGLLALLAWILLPIAAFFDMKYIRSNSEWNPNSIVWVIAMIIWLFNIVAAAVYLYRRHEVLDVP